MTCFIHPCSYLISEKELVTPPLEGLILPGVTRASILDMTREWNRFKITERNITMAEIVELVQQKRVSAITLIDEE